MLYIVSMLRLGTSGKVSIEMDRDFKVWLELCFYVIGYLEEVDIDVWLKLCGEFFVLMIEEKFRCEF